MGVVPDELLMAYADGELDAAESRRVELRLAADPEARERLEVFLRTGRAIGRTLDIAAFADVPGRLADAVRLAAPSPSRSAARSALSGTGSDDGWVARALRRMLPVPDLPWRFALALSGILVLGTGLGWLLATIPGASHQHDALVRAEGVRLLASGALARALDRSPSSTEMRGDTAGPDTIVAPRMTFTNAAQEFCRHYRIVSGSGARSEGVACRETDGRWRIEAQVAPPAAAQPRENGYAPAGGEDGAALDAVIDRLIVGDPLDMRSEAEVLAREWRKKPR